MKRPLTKITFALVIVLIVAMAGATVFEKIYGSQRVVSDVYGSWWFAALWGVLAVLSIILIVKSGMSRRLAVLTLHLSFIIILAGALVTHIFGTSGVMHLRVGEGSVSSYAEKDYGNKFSLPFSIAVDGFETVCYPGTETPSDFVSHLLIDIEGEKLSERVSINKALKIKGYKFVNSSYDSDMQGVSLSVSHDAAGTTITYIGYWLLFASMILFFFEKRTRFRALLKRVAVVSALLFTGAAANASDAPKTLPKAEAEEFGVLMVNYNGRICPVSVLASDVVCKAHGSKTYKGLSAEQIFTGWLFFPESWVNEPFVKVKDANLRNRMGLKGKYASMAEFYNFATTVSRDDLPDAASMENFNIIKMIAEGELLRIFPVKNSDGRVRWLSSNEASPREISEEEVVFMRNIFNYLSELAVTKDYATFDEVVGKISKFQQKNGAETIPPKWKTGLEIFYSRHCESGPLAILLIVLGLVAYFMTVIPRKPNKMFGTVMVWITVVCFIVLTAMMVVRGLVAGHFPLSNGFETMQAMAWCVLLAGIILNKTYPLATPSALLTGGLALIVAMMGEATPQVTPLMPVLASPLLSVHVMLVMIAYALLALIMLNGVTGLAYAYSSRTEESERLKSISEILLYPAVFALTAGIFVGAIWANVSWGRYWGWDPKEVWALITMLIYMLPFHSNLLPFFKNTRKFHLFSALAFLSVVITYFGVNFLLGGLHSYA